MPFWRESGTLNPLQIIKFLNGAVESVLNRYNLIDYLGCISCPHLDGAELVGLVNLGSVLGL